MCTHSAIRSSILQWSPLQVSILVESHKQSGEADFQRSNHMKKRWRGKRSTHERPCPESPPPYLRKCSAAVIAGHHNTVHGAVCSGGAGGKWWLVGASRSTSLLQTLLLLHCSRLVGGPFSAYLHPSCGLWMVVLQGCQNSSSSVVWHCCFAPLSPIHEMLAKMIISQKQRIAIRKFLIGTLSDNPQTRSTPAPFVNTLCAKLCNLGTWDNFWSSLGNNVVGIGYLLPIRDEHFPYFSSKENTFQCSNWLDIYHLPLL